MKNVTPKLLQIAKSTPTKWQIYTLNFKGCHSCFACKRKSNFYGKGCAMKDDFTQVMNDMLAADAWIFATPIYNGPMSSSMSALLERLYFSHCNYDAHERMVEREYPSALIYSMNGNQQFMSQMGIENSCKYDAFLLEKGLVRANTWSPIPRYNLTITANIIPPPFPLNLKQNLARNFFRKI